MAKQCTKLMLVLKQNICSLELSYSLGLDDAAKWLYNYLTLELRYACVH